MKTLTHHLLLSLVLLVIVGLLALERLQETQDLDEQIDNVLAEIDHANNVLLGAQVLYDHVVGGEDRRARHTHNRLSHAITHENLF
jgi:hypothetical protein